MKKKYRLTDEIKLWCGHTLHRIEALKNFGNVKKGNKGGWIESEGNLSQEGYCWVSDNAWVSGRAVVRDNAIVCDNAWVYDYAIVCGNARVCGNAVVRINAKVGGNARVCGKAVVSGNAVVYGDAVVSDTALVSGDAQVCWDAEVCGDAVITKMGDELIKKAYADSERSGIEYQRVVNYVQGILGLPNIERDGTETKQFTIKTMNDVVAFITYVILVLGIDINPEDSFKDVTDKDGKRTMSDEDAERYDKTIEDCFKVCEENGKDLYQIFFRVLGLHSYANDNEMLRILCDKNVEC